MEKITTPCRKCGSANRNNSGKCRPCLKLRSAQWAVDNIEKARASSLKWRTESPEKVTACARKYLEANREKVNARNAKWAKENPEKVKAKSLRWRLANLERAKANGERWKKEHPEMRRAHGINRRAVKLKAGGTFTTDDIKTMLKRQRNKCVVCKANISATYHIDHIMPLTLGGNNSIGNIQLLCPSCNMSKCAHHPIDFMQSRGFLL